MAILYTRWSNEASKGLLSECEKISICAYFYSSLVCRAFSTAGKPIHSSCPGKKMAAVLACVFLGEDHLDYWHKSWNFKPPTIALCMLAQPNNNFFSFWVSIFVVLVFVPVSVSTSNTISFLHFHMSSFPWPMQYWPVYELIEHAECTVLFIHYRYKSKHLTGHGAHLPAKQTEFVRVDQGNHDIVRPFGFSFCVYTNYASYG